MTNSEFPLVSKTGKRYREEGDMRIYESGAVYDMQAKSFAGGAITSENAAQFQESAVTSRYEKAQQAAMRGIIAGVEATELAKKIAKDGRLSSETAWEAIVAAQARLAMDEDKGNSSTRAAEFVGKATGFTNKPDNITLKQGSNSVTGTPDNVRELLRMLNSEIEQRNRKE